MPLSLKPT